MAGRVMSERRTVSCALRQREVLAYRSDQAVPHGILIQHPAHAELIARTIIKFDSVASISALVGRGM
jgi:hypothetical protein